MNRQIVKLKRELINESQQLYREFSKSLLTISAALIAAIIIYSGRLSPGDMPVLIMCSIIGFIMSIGFGVSFQLYTFKEVMDIVDLIDNNKEILDEILDYDDPSLETSKTYKFIGMSQVISFYLSFIIIFVALIQHFFF